MIPLAQLREIGIEIGRLFFKFPIIEQNEFSCLYLVNLQ